MRDKNTLSTTLPITDLLLYGEYGSGIIPKDVCMNTAVREAATFRLTLTKEFEDIFSFVDRTSHTSVPKLTTEGKLEEKVVIELYKKLIIFLHSDQYNKRIVLYLPFELLPEQTWRSPSRALHTIVTQFTELYLSKWRMMLAIHDVKANFVDGDLIDQEQQRISPRVVKAAHLLPVLVQKGLVTTEEVLRLLQESSHTVLRNSIADAISVITDLGLLSKEDNETMRQSKNALVRALASFSNSFEEKSLATKEFVDLDDAYRQMEQECTQAPVISLKGKTEARIKWEKQRDADDFVDRYSDSLCTLLSRLKATIVELTEMMQNNPPPLVVATAIAGIRKFCITLARTEKERAETLASHAIAYFQKLYKKDNREVRESIEVACNHWCTQGLISQKEIAVFGFEPKRLQRRCTDQDIASIPDVEKIKNFLALLDDDDELSRYIFPVMILYGSRIKGYATAYADSDSAVFIRPGVAFEKRTHIRYLLAQAMDMCGLSMKPLEFWTTECEMGLAICDIDSDEVVVGQSYFAQVLFHGVWIGENRVKNDIAQKLLPRYFSPDVFRSTWLEELERNTIVYRLLHKGYIRFYPITSPFCTEHSGEIDGNSAFWDTGFRILATTLFFKKVYLPLVY